MSLLDARSFEWPAWLGRRAAAARKAARRAAPNTASTHHRRTIESALFAALLDQEHLGVGVCDHDGVLTMVDPALEQMLGAADVQVGPSPGLRRFPLHDETGTPLREEQDPLVRALRGESVTSQVVTVRRPGDPVRFVRCSAFQLRGSGSEVLSAVVLAVDVTDWMTEQHTLDELRDRLVTAVNHEVRTPLAVISGHMELISDQAEPLPEDLVWSLGAIDRATAHLGDVVNTISEIADQSMAIGPH